MHLTNNNKIRLGNECKILREYLIAPRYGIITPHDATLLYIIDNILNSLENNRSNHASQYYDVLMKLNNKSWSSSVEFINDNKLFKNY